MVLCLEFVHFLRDAALREHVEVQPGYAALDADVAGERRRQHPNTGPGLLGRHALHGEVARLAEQVGGQIDLRLAFHQLTHVAAQPPLMGAVRIG